MDFDLNDEQKMLQESVKALLEDANSHLVLTQKNDCDPQLDQALWKALCELGIPAILPPEDTGGLAMGLLTLAVTAQMLGRYAVSAPLAEHALVVHAVATSGNDAASARWLDDLLTGQKVATLAWGEGGGHWMPEQWHLDARNGVLNGSKANVTFAADADLLLVGLAGGRLALVERNAPGLKLLAVEPVDRTHPLFTATFSDTPCTLLTQDAALARRLCDAALVLLAADAYGAASQTLDMAVEYAKTREQFGRKIGEFQAIKFQLANMALDLEPTRALFWYAAHAWDAIPDDAPRAAALAKAHTTDVAVRTARMAVEIHGGIAITWEFVLHIFLKRALYDRIALGLPDLHRERMAQLAGW